ENDANEEFFHPNSQGRDYYGSRGEGSHHSGRGRGYRSRVFPGPNETKFNGRDGYKYPNGSFYSKEKIDCGNNSIGNVKNFYTYTPSSNQNSEQNKTPGNDIQFNAKLDSGSEDLDKYLGSKGLGGPRKHGE
ncbi:MAG: hypothetical protein LBU15_02425, partial [Rickettsiales bacterium]|nr:hypothetical protein [Rickettsiales bacterium]